MAINLSTLLNQNSAQLCKAWVNFNGTTSTPSTIRSSYNVSSITKNATGDYTVNFTTALTDANYSTAGSAGTSSAVNALVIAPFITPQTTASIRIATTNVTSGLTDYPYVSIQVFGN